MEPLKLSVPLPDVLHEVDGDIRVKGHRISLYHIISAYNNQWIGPEAMVFYYPTLSYDEIQKVFAFYRANRAVVDEYVRECEARMEAVMATAKRVPIEEYRRRFEAMRAKSAEVNGVVHPSPTEAPHAPAD
jgi:uncharacterized protein (DUF433 family)